VECDITGVVLRGGGAVCVGVSCGRGALRETSCGAGGSVGMSSGTGRRCLRRGSGARLAATFNEIVAGGELTVVVVVVSEEAGDQDVANKKKKDAADNAASPFFLL
jgi:hypothetical protein